MAILNDKPYVLVVGGVNVDIGGRAFAPLIAADSNPGRVSTTLGGVGRNIAHNLALLGANVGLLTAYGDDLHGHRVEASCARQGIDLRHALRIPGGTTSTYLYLADHKGEMALAVSDMSICEKITPEYLAEQRALLQNAAAVVADANIPAESLGWLGENLSVPLFADPVSVTKAEKLLPILGKIHTLKPNRLEAELLSGIPIRDKASLEAAADKLLASGLKRIFISLGAKGVFAADQDQRLYLPNFPGKMVNTTGCGDAFMAALVWAYLEKMDLKESARAGLAAGSIAMEAEATINPQMNADAVKGRMCQ